MNYEAGRHYLITTTDWFFAPDGESYKAAYGPLVGVFSSEDTLGVRTNSRSTNWYVHLGNMMIAGCQINYVIQSDDVSFAPPTAEADYNGERVGSRAPITRIYDARQSSLAKVA